MIKSMGEVLAAGCSDGMDILEEVSRELAERLVNNRQPFVMVHVQDNGDVVLCQEKAQIKCNQFSLF